MADYRSNIKDEVEVTPYRKIQKGSIIGEMIKDRTITKNKLAEGVIPPINNKHNYSTTEQVVGTWVDGRPIYEKTFEVSSPYFKNGDWLNTHIIIPNIDNIISVSSTVVSSNNEQGLFIGVFNKINNNGELEIYSPVGWNTTGQTTTIRYTKTTDVPNA